jgi:hypothetical protein
MAKFTIEKVRSLDMGFLQRGDSGLAVDLSIWSNTWTNLNRKGHCATHQEDGTIPCPTLNIPAAMRDNLFRKSLHTKKITA